jgi:hypothetical protein
MAPSLSTIFVLGAGLQICIHTLFVLSVNRRGPVQLWTQQS